MGKLHAVPGDLGLVPTPNKFGGRLISGPNAVVTEVRGLGNQVAFDFPQLSVVGTPEEYIEAGNSRAVMHFKVPYWQRGVLMVALTGWPIQTAAGYRRHLPEIYRNWQWQISDAPAGRPDGIVVGPAVVTDLIPVMYCTKATSVGHGLRADWVTQNPDKVGDNYYPDPQFEWAIVTAVFETLAYDVFTLSEIAATPARPAEMQRYVIKTKDSDGKYLQYAVGQFVLETTAGAGTAGGWIPLGRTNVNFWEAFEVVRYEWFDVLPGMTNHPRNQLLCGQGNSVQFDDFAPGTLFLRKATEVPKRDQFGRRVFNYVFEMLHIPTGINKALKPGSRSNDPASYLNVISSKSDGQQNPYNLTDLTVIFKP